MGLRVVPNALVAFEDADITFTNVRIPFIWINKTFKDFLLHEKVQETLEKLGFVTPTEIQAKAIPVLLEKKQPIFMVKLKREQEKH